MQNKKNNIIPQLKTWLFTKPVLFAISFFVLSAVLFMIYGAISTALDMSSVYPMYVLFMLSLIACIWYTIKKLPHDKMNQNDFIAITNGTTLISIFATLIPMTFIILYGSTLRAHLLMFYLMHQSLCILLFLLFLLISLYVIGVSICGIYAKYKRAESIGISPWKIVLSMPFAFLLMWTPGYLLKGKDIKSNLQIKCQWYSKLQKWVMGNSSNILFTFLFLLFCKGVITGWATFILYATLIILYALWYIKHKSDFIKDVNKGYAMTAIGINIAIILAIIAVA